MEIIGRGLFVAFLLIAFLAIAFLVVAGHARRVANQTDQFRKLARRLGGHFHGGGLFEPNEVAFDHGGTWGRVDIFATGSKNPIRYTRVRFVWPAAEVRCEVFPEKIAHRLGKLLGMVDLEIGVPEFDHDYIISGSDQRRIEQLLTAEVRALLQQMRAQSDDGDVYFSVGGSEVTLRRRGLFDNDGELERFVRRAIDLYDAIVHSERAGVEFLDDQTATIVIDAKTMTSAACQVCGEQIGADPVLCKTCRTPHHHDCWEYYGQCSTFGCRERAYFRPRRQPPAKGRK